MVLKVLKSDVFFIFFIIISAVFIYTSSLNLIKAHTLFITFITASLWMTEKLPIPVSSLLPIALFPLLGILSPQQVAQSYGNPLILLLLGGLMLSTAMSHTGTHKLIANKIIAVIGTDSQSKILLSFMIAAVILSMWISNTATTLMLLPIALAILETNTSKNFTVVLLLGIAYSASIGGTATPIGTPPNLLLIQSLKDANGTDIGFISWISQVAPVLFIILPIVFIYLKSSLNKNPVNFIISNYKINNSQKKILMVFLITAILWMTRVEPFGGWRTLLDLPQANDASVALLAVVLLFILRDSETKSRIMDWEAVNKIPWGILLLFAGGITIATAFRETRLSETIAQNLIFLNNFPVWSIIGITCLFVTFLTEITSNTATTAVLLPILLSTSEALNLDPMILMLPATISASFAFMMPVATAPNAIVFSSEKVPIKRMMRLGLGLNLIGATILTIYFSLSN